MSPHCLTTMTRRLMSLFSFRWGRLEYLVLEYHTTPTHSVVFGPIWWKLSLTHLWRRLLQVEAVPDTIQVLLGSRVLVRFTKLRQRYRTGRLMASGIQCLKIQRGRATDGWRNETGHQHEMMALEYNNQRWVHSTRHSTSQAPRHSAGPSQGSPLQSGRPGVRPTNQHSMLLTF